MVVALPPGSAGGKVGCVNNVSLKRIEIINLRNDPNLVSLMLT
jgi:hypothetical protein